MKTGTCTKCKQLIHRTLCQKGIIVNYVIFTVLKNQPIKVIRIFNEMKLFPTFKSYSAPI